MRLSGALLAQSIPSNGFRTVASGSQNGFVESTIIHHSLRLSSASRACAKIGSSTSSADVLGGFELVVILHDAIVVETRPPVEI
jgi:hypothetical protein